jgi:hypothetical protein
MNTIEDKQIAKELLIEMLRKDLLTRYEYKEAASITEKICCAYKDLLKTISE